MYVGHTVCEEHAVYACGAQCMCWAAQCMCVWHNVCDTRAHCMWVGHNVCGDGTVYVTGHSVCGEGTVYVATAQCMW